jgi:hypothetical protein
MTKDTPAENKSWRPGQKGQGGEGMSKGYGGSAGKGTGPSGPDSDKPDAKRKKKNSPRQTASQCLPTPEKIAEVLR